MIPFEYKRPKSLAEALDLLAQHPDEAQLLAGGHTLLPLLKMRMAAADILVDIQDLDDLQGIEERDNGFHIGALTRHVDLLKSDILFKEWPIIRQTAALIADLQVRNRGTIGGSLSAADPSADWPAIALLLGAELTLQSQSGQRRVAAADYFIGMMETVREPDEILTEITLPRNKNAFNCSYQKFRHPASGYAVASAAAGISIENGLINEARIAISGVGDHPYLAIEAAKHLLGQKPSTALFAEAVTLVTQGQNILSDHFADAAYRTQLAQTMCRRALSHCQTPDFQAAN